MQAKSKLGKKKSIVMGAFCLMTAFLMCGCNLEGNTGRTLYDDLMDGLKAKTESLVNIEGGTGISRSEQCSQGQVWAGNGAKQDMEAIAEQMRSRISHACTEEATERHRLTGHRKYDPECIDCVQAKGKNRPHKKNAGDGPHKIGVVAADIAVFSKEGPFVMVMVAKNDKGENVYFAGVLPDKTKESIAQMVMEGLLQLEMLYNL